MKKRNLLILSVVFAMMTAFPAMAEGNTYHSEAFDARISDMKARFPEGKYWQHMGVNDPDSVLDSPVCTKSYHTDAEMASGSCGCNSFSSSIQCNGFAKYMGWLVFGTDVYTQWTEYENRNRDAGENISIGDYVRLPGHSLFIIDITGDTFTSYSCWGSQGSKIAVETYTKQELNTQTDIYRHANNYEEILGSSEPVVSGDYEAGWNFDLEFWRYWCGDHFARNEFVDLGRDRKYYFKDDTSLVWGTWYEADGKWYHAAEDGHADLGWQHLDGEWYYFNDPSGEMKRNSWQKYGNNKYYLSNTGARYRNTTRSIDGKTYQFDDDGVASEARQKKSSTISGETKPGILNKGDFFGLRGTVNSQYEIVSLSAKITDRQKHVIQEKTVYPGSLSYDLSGEINDSLIFNDLPTGGYCYIVTVSDSNGYEKSVVKKNFYVKEKK